MGEQFEWSFEMLKRKGEQVAEYYKRSDLPEPSDDETARPSPLPKSPNTLIEQNNES